METIISAGATVWAAVAATIAAIIALSTRHAIVRQANIMTLQANAGTAVHYMKLIDGLNRDIDRVRSLIESFRRDTLDDIGRIDDSGSEITSGRALDLRQNVLELVRELSVPSPVTDTSLNNSRSHTLENLSKMDDSLEGIFRIDDLRRDPEAFSEKQEDEINERNRLNVKNIFGITRDVRRSLRSLLDSYEDSRQRAGSVMGYLSSAIDNDISRQIIPNKISLFGRLRSKIIRNTP